MNQQPPYETSWIKDWLNPVDVLKLRDAVAKQQTIVRLSSGEFKIEYHHLKCRVQITTDFAPNGWFTYEQLSNYEFESDHDKHL